MLSKSLLAVFLLLPVTLLQTGCAGFGKKGAAKPVPSWQPVEPEKSAFESNPANSAIPAIAVNNYKEPDLYERIVGMIPLTAEYQKQRSGGDRPFWMLDTRVMEVPENLRPSSGLFDVSVGITNTSKELSSMQFQTSREIEIAIKDQRGNQVMLWTNEKVLETSLHRKVINPGETLTYKATFPSDTLRSGQRYTVEARVVGYHVFGLKAAKFLDVK